LDNITATYEKERLIPYANDYIKIENASGTVTDALYQAFYNQPHDGMLENYSIGYRAPYYDSGNGDPYLGVRSNFSDPATDVTGWIAPFSTSSVNTTATHDCSAENALLNASTVYYVVINGTHMTGVDFGSFWLTNIIQWRSSKALLGGETGYHIRNTGDWEKYQTHPDFWQEGELNYTYTPWNTTSNSAMVYTSPQDIQLKGNSTVLTGNTWTFSSNANISYISFDSGQSVDVRCNLTLSYKRDVTSETLWSASSPGSSINWNATSTLNYPAMAGILDRGMNVTVPSDWSAVGLYNATHPSENYAHFTQSGDNITCTSLDDDDWTVLCSAPNYVRSLSTFDESDDSLISHSVSVFVTMDINSTIESPSSIPASGGAANLTVMHDDSATYSEESLAIAGLSYHQWDIETGSSGNGVYILQVYWSNGTEAGYLTASRVVLYPTQITAAKTKVNAYTESSFDVSIFFNDTFTPKGLNSTFAQVNYTFATVLNNSMFDHPNGTWSRTIDTTGLDSGVYELIIYAEGFAFQNQSTTISVTLIHETLPLNIEWTPESDITFVEQAQLSVTYRKVGGDNVTDASVNVTIGAKTWNLTWDAASEVYRITFNGSDALPGFGSFGPIVSAWKQGHTNQTSVTALTISLEPVTLSASWTKYQFDWTQSTTLSFEYRDTYGTLIDQAAQKLVWINGTESVLQGDNGTYWIELDNRFDLGYHSVVANVSKYGYVSGYNDTVEFTINLASTYFAVDWSSAVVDYLGRFSLSVIYALDSDDSSVPMLEVVANITIDGTTVLDLNQTGTFWIGNLTGTYLDLGPHNVVIQAWAYGYEFQTNSTTLTVDEVSTQLTFSWASHHGNNISYIQSTILYINYTISVGGSVEEWTIEVVVGGTPWAASWNTSLGVYECHFMGTDNPPGLGTHPVSIDASRYGYQNKTDNSQLTLRAAETSISTEWSRIPPVTFVENTTLIVVYNTSIGRINDASVVATIGVDSWPMNWSIANQDYRIQFNGTDSIPGIGKHTVSITATKAGYAQAYGTLELEIEFEPATLTFDWSPDHNITYFENTVLTIYYRMNGNNSVIKGATLNVTIDTTLWNAHWNDGAGAYQIRFNGSDIDPGLGNHSVIVRAWRYGFWGLQDENETLDITEEFTLLQASWSSPNLDTITYLNSTELRVSYTMLNGTAIWNANVTATEGSSVWELNWNPFLESYTIQFNGTDPDLGIGGHSLVVFAWREHFYNKTALQTLTVIVEPASLDVSWSNGFNITFVQHTELIVLYSLINTTPIEGATVNVTIGINTWNLTWYDGDGTYRIRFNGSDDPPGLHSHNLSISAWKYGFLSQTNDTAQLELKLEPTSIDVIWIPDAPISYLDSIMLYVNFTMNNGSIIPNANVVADLGEDPWPLLWNNSLGLYQLQINGSDTSVGTGNHTVYIWAVKSGYITAYDYTQTIRVQSEETLLSLSWETQYENEITFIERTTLYANYTLINGTPIENALVNVTIISKTWRMTWNQTLEVYQVTFNGSDSQPGLGTFYPIVEAWRYGYANRTSSTSLQVNLEPTTLTGDWSWADFEWYDTLFLYLEYRDSRGSLIGQATQKLIWVNGSEDTLLGTDGVYRILLDKRFDLGFHNVVANVSKHGYEAGYNDTIAFSIIPAGTFLTVDWSTASADYLHGFNLTVDYALTSIPMWVPTGDVLTRGSINLTIDGGLVLQLNSSGRYWTANLTSAFLGLGPHTIYIQAWAYGYENQTHTSILTVNPVATSLTYSWSPANVTIEYTEHLNLTVNYTYYGGDVPATAVVNVTINGRTFNLTYAAGFWEVSLNGSDIGIGFFEATISSWEPVFQGQLAAHPGVNITAARNTFFVDPFGPSVSYVENVGFYVTYTQDYQPILGANVTLTLNGTRLQYLTYNATDTKWHLILAAADIGLGVWNVTLRANKTGYVPGFSSGILAVEEDIPILTPAWTVLEVDYITPVDLIMGVNTSDGAPVLDATVWFTMAGSTEVATHLGAGIYLMDLGQYIPIGPYSINVTVARFAIRRTTWFATLNVTNAAATIQLDYSNATIYYDEYVNLNVSYYMSNGSHIAGASCSLVINGTPHTVVPSIDHWEAVIDGTIGAGLYPCVITVSAYGFDTLVDDFFVQVHLIPTYITITGEFSNYVNSTIAIEVSYFDARTSSSIGFGILNVVWPDTHSVVNQGIGVASIRPDTSLHVGNYTLSFTLTKTGHEDTYEELTLELLPIPTSIVVDNQLSEYTNETIVITALLNDTHNNRPISWANVVLSFRGTDCVMEYQPAIQMYTAEIWLTMSIPVGEHEIVFNATAVDCLGAEKNATLIVQDKATYSVAIAVSTDEATEGEDIVATATVTDTGMGVAGVNVRFVFTVIPREGVAYEMTMTGVTGSDGAVDVTFELPDGGTQVEVRAVTEASRTAWSVQSESRIVTIREAEDNPLIGLLEDPLVQLMIVAGSVAAIGGVALRSRKRTPTARVRDAAAILQQLPFFVKAEFCTLFNLGDRKYVLVRALESSPEAYQVRAISFLAQEELVGALELAEDSEVSLEIHGLELYFYGGKRLIGAVTAKDTVDDAAKTELQSLVEALEKEYETELLDWPNTLKRFETDWVIVGPDSSEAEGIKALIFTNPQGLTRTEIADISGIPSKRANKLVKNILELDSDFSEVKSGRKKLILYSASKLDEES
jgi:hypothetical protein